MSTTTFRKNRAPGSPSVRSCQTSEIFCEPGFTPDVPLAEHASLTFVVGPKHQLGYSKMSATQWGWWCHVPSADDEQRAALLSMPAGELAQRMLERYHGWCAPIGELIARSRVWVRTPIHDVPHLPTWHRAHAVLIGDAAHAMSPAGTIGAGSASRRNRGAATTTTR